MSIIKFFKDSYNEIFSSEPFLIVNHPIRSFLLSGFIIIFFLIVIFYFTFVFYSILFNISILPLIDSTLADIPFSKLDFLSIGKNILFFIVGILIYLVLVLVCVGWISRFMNECKNLMILASRGKKIIGIVESAWTTEKKLPRSSKILVTHHYKVQIKPQKYYHGKEIVLYGFSQESFLQELLEKNFTKGEELPIMIDPYDSRRARVIY